MSRITPAPSMQSIILDALKFKIRQTKHELDQYKDDYTQCQQMLANEISQRSICEAANLRLEQCNATLEREKQMLREQVDSHAATLRDTLAALEESDRQRKAMEHRNQLQTEEIYLISWQLREAKRQAAEAEYTATSGSKRLATLTDKLEHCEQQLEASVADNALLQAELHAVGKNVYCVELEAEKCAHHADKCEHKVDQLQRRLRESEQRALLAECSAYQLHLYAERLEQGWHNKPSV